MSRSRIAKVRAFSALGVLVVLTLVPVGCRLAPTAESTRDQAGTDRRITSDAAEQAAPDVSGTRIVWEDARHGQTEIYLHDVSTGQERRLTSDPAEQTSPRISGDRVVWEDRRHGGRDVYLLDLDSGGPVRLTPEGSDQTQPDVSGDRVVWRDDRTGAWNLRLYDVSTDEETTVETGSAPLWPSVSEDRVAWLEGGRIRTLDLTTGEILDLTGVYSVSTEDGLALDGSRVAWTDDRIREDRNVWVHDFQTGTTTQATEGFEHNLLGDVDGERVVTVDFRPGRGGGDVFLRELGSEEVIQVNPWNVTPRGLARLDGRRVVYAGLRDGGVDVFMFELE